MIKRYFLKISFIVLSIVVLTKCNNIDLSKYNSNNNDFNIKAKVKYFKIQRFQYNDNAKVKIGKIDSQGKEFHFSTKGFLTKKLLFNEETGEIDGNETYTYNNLDLISEINWTNPLGEHSKRMIISYDKNGNKIGAITTGYNDKFLGSQKLILDKGANILLNITKDEQGIIDSCIYEYNSNGNRIKQTCYDKNSKYKNIVISKHKKNTENMAMYNSENKLQNYYIIKYDNKKNKIQEFIYNSDSSFNYGFFYKYNNNGKIILERGIISEADTIGNYDSFRRNIYNNKGKLTQETFWRTNTDTTTYKYKYDEEMNQISIMRFTNDSLTYTITNKYEYDSHKNWIKQTVYENDKPTHIWVREIVYYEE